MPRVRWVFLRFPAANVVDSQERKVGKILAFGVFSDFFWMPVALKRWRKDGSVEYVFVEDDLLIFPGVANVEVAGSLEDLEGWELTTQRCQLFI